MAPLSAIWIDRFTRVTFLKGEPDGFVTEDEWHVDFCAMPTDPNPRVIDPREIYQTIRVRETADGWVTVDLCTPAMAVKAINAVETAEQKNDAIEVEANTAISKVLAGILVAGVPAAQLSQLAGMAA